MGPSTLVGNQLASNQRQVGERREDALLAAAKAATERLIATRAGRMSQLGQRFGVEGTIEDALNFFSAVPVIHRKLQTLMDVGLSYIRLGQNATTLSGGEAQRVKLSRELSKRESGSTLYILDEPTTGLHFHDIKQLLAVLHQLRDHGNTIVVIEHNLDVIKTADWLIDMGPEGGDKGGEVLIAGTPEDIAAYPGSHTGRFLAPVLERQRYVEPRRVERRG